jgi:hypothetical protein
VLVDRRNLGLYAALSGVFFLNLLYAYTRSYAQTFALPGWLETTIFSDGGTRVLSTLATMTVPWAFSVLFTWRGEAAGGPIMPSV